MNIPTNMHRLKYKYILSLLFLLFISVRSSAQDISVTEFYLDEKDLTANGRHAVEDQNGDKCALIRVQTTQKGFSFDVGSAGITKVEDDHVGEVWLWVPFGIRHISIRHQQLGSLHDLSPVPLLNYVWAIILLTMSKRPPANPSALLTSPSI